MASLLIINLYRCYDRKGINRAIKRIAIGSGDFGKTVRSPLIEQVILECIMDDFGVFRHVHFFHEAGSISTDSLDAE